MYYKIHKLPLMQGKEKMQALYGDEIEKLKKEVQKMSDDLKQ